MTIFFISFSEFRQALQFASIDYLYKLKYACDVKETFNDFIQANKAQVE